MTGNQFSDLIAQYILHRFGDRGVIVYREISIGKSIIGKNRKIDILVLDSDKEDAFAIECKYQATQGTADEKIPYTLDDIAALQMAGCVAYGGEGFSAGVTHMLEASELAAFCVPESPAFAATKETRQLDHLLAMHFRWWDVLVRNKQPVVIL